MLAYTRDLLLKCHKYCELIKISQADNEWQETIMYRRNISSYVTVLVHSAMHRQETFTSEDDAILAIIQQITYLTIKTFQEKQYIV